MIRICLAALLGILACAGSAAAATCNLPYPNTLTNGTNADATQVMANLEYLRNCILAIPAPPTAVASSSTPRQTVSAGPVTTAGLSNFLPATAGSLSLTTQNVSGAVPLAVTAANNVDTTSGAQKDLIGVTTTNLTWSSLTASSTLYLYVTVATNGTLTAGATAQAPIYQWGGTPATTSGLFTFNIGEMKGYLGNGSIAPQAYVVFLGEAVTSGSVVTSTVAYAYNGKYDSGYTATLPAYGTAINRSHNIGILPRIANLLVQNTTAEGNYAVGDEIGVGSLNGNDGGIVSPGALSASTKTVNFISSGSTTPWQSTNKTTGVRINLTAGSWKYRMVADRGW